MQPHFIVIGLSDAREQYFQPAVIEAIGKGSIFSGGSRHHQIVSAHLPADAQWIDICIPLQETFRQYQGHPEIVVFASGDPFFFGFANTLQREFPDCRLTVYPSFHSLQLLAHRHQLPYHDLHMVSLTGRPWHCFDKALIQGEPFIGILTDRKHTPNVIARRMIDYGYTNYRCFTGECLGNADEERLRELSVEEVAAETNWRHPNCLIIKQTAPRNRLFGIPDDAFHHLEGRPNMLTKMPIRLLTLSMLDLANKSCLWDIGFCTGSVSIEAKLQFPHLQIQAFEIRTESERLMQLNTRKFGTPGIDWQIGDFLETSIDRLPRPDCVFIGGHGGKLAEIISRLRPYLLPNAVIVTNAVSESSIQLFINVVQAAGLQITTRHRIVVDKHNPIEILKAL